MSFQSALAASRSMVNDAYDAKDKADKAVAAKATAATNEENAIFDKSIANKTELGAVGGAAEGNMAVGDYGRTAQSYTTPVNGFVRGNGMA